MYISYFFSLYYLIFTENKILSGCRLFNTNTHSSF